MADSPTTHGSRNCPSPSLELTWDNAAFFSPDLAGQLGISNEEVVELSYQGRILRLPVWIMPGQAQRLGNRFSRLRPMESRKRRHEPGLQRLRVRTSQAPWFSTGLEVTKTGERYPLAAVQHHHVMQGRDLVRVGTVNEYQRNPDFAQEPDRRTSKV